MIIIEKRYRKYFDYISFCTTLLLACIGLAFIFSATYTTMQPYSLFFKKQLLGIVSGSILYICSSYIDHRVLLRWGYYGYIMVIGLLFFTIIKGSIGMGAQRWVNLFFFKLQPSELAKLLFPAYAAYHLSFILKNKHKEFIDFIPTLLILALSFVLILKQPDLGTALILLFSGLIIVWQAGISKRFFLYGMVGVTLLTPCAWHVLKDYQKKRILVFFGQGDMKKERYHIEQSKITIGSGGLFGKGFLQGTQNQLNFLPESRTDFIFSIIAEETGFVGTLFVLFLYLFLFFRLFSIALMVKEPTAQLLAVGLIAPLVLSMLVNICMVIGLLPIVGQPLPLISYGISNLWTTMITLGWLNSIAMHRAHLIMS